MIQSHELGLLTFNTTNERVKNCHRAGISARKNPRGDGSRVPELGISFDKSSPREDNSGGVWKDTVREKFRETLHSGGEKIPTSRKHRETWGTRVGDGVKGTYVENKGISTGLKMRRRSTIAFGYESAAKYS